MNLPKAKQLLERLRMRTESRGATPAEAVQAAELAERIAKRYGLDIETVGDVDRRYAIAEKRMPSWVNVLICALQIRFKIRAKYTVQTGKPVEIIFTGPDHLVGVSIWLFKAIRIDLHKRSTMAAGAMALKGGPMVRFKNQFKLNAVLEINRRLNPPEPTTITPEELEAWLEKQNSRRKKNACKKTPKQRRKMLQRELYDMLAFEHGRKAGKQIEIDTNVIGDKSERVLIESESSK